MSTDVSADVEQHVHRIALTGCADRASGLALSLASPTRWAASPHRPRHRYRAEMAAAGWPPRTPWRPRCCPPWTPADPRRPQGKRSGPGDILGALTGEAGFAAAQIGKIT